MSFSNVNFCLSLQVRTMAAARSSRVRIPSI
jgi:hypothetical protein